jgi:OFA family oxalate/formate antiporter-like MFS transporter
MISIENKWIRGALPALFIHVCIGSVYCWSLLKGNIAEEMGVPVPNIEMAFSLAIFFLGMSAAFGGHFVEKNVKAASLTSLICFVLGLFGAAYAIHLKSVPMLFLTYGSLMGIGLGIGYLSPVKTLMLWFKEHPGLATGIAISGFGLSKVVFSPIIECLLPSYGAAGTLVIMGTISVIPMMLAAVFIHKPKDWVEEKTKFSLKDSWNIITNTKYLRIWFIFYLNITCGLALISFEKPIAIYLGITAIALLSSMTALFNTLGRFGYATSSDYLKRKMLIYSIIFASSTIMCYISGFTMASVMIVCMLMIINAGYGGGFSTLPIVLKERFGMDKISTIHGFALSAWAWAGLSGNQLSSYIIDKHGYGYNVLFYVLGSLYLLSFLITLSLYIKQNKEA